MTENGWPPDTRARPGVSLPRNQMDDNPIPGTGVRIPLQRGIPNVIMKAVAADYNLHVEPLQQRHCGGWTNGNSVATSNHLGGTAMDLNWEFHPFHKRGSFNAAQMQVIEELENFYEGMIFWAGRWDNPVDEMHWQMGYHTFDNIPKCEDFIRRKILPTGFSTYRRGSHAPPQEMQESYGLPPGSNSGGYGGNGVKFPDWVYQLGNAFGVKPSTYPGHQESDRNEAGYAPNPQHLNRAIDWAAPGDRDEIEKLTRFADYLATIPQHLEQVIWQNPRTMRSIEIAGGRHQPGYFASDLAGHRDHVHTRQSHSIPLPGGAPPPPPPPVLSRAERYALEVKREGERRGITQRGIQIAFSVCFVESNWKMYANSNVPESLAKNPDGTDKYPHDAVGSDHDSLGLFQQRSPMWGQPACLMNAACSAGLFYDRLVKMNYNDPARLPGSFAADVQRPAAQYRGRYQERYGEAAALYNRLSQIAAPVEEDDFLSALSAQEQRDLYNAIMNKRESRSPLRHLGEGQVGDSMDQIWDIDASVHLLTLGMLASLHFPDPEALALLQEVAEADLVQFPERQRDKKLARAILAGLGTAPAARVTPTPVSMPPPSYPEPEVLPAIRPAPVKSNTPEELLDTIDRLNVFRRDFDKRFDALTAEKPKELDE